MKKIIESLMKNLEKPETPQEIDLIIDGGGFKASYMLGNLLYLKEMEKQGFVKVARISGTSAGSLLGLLYFLDELNIVYKLLPIFSKDYKKTNKLTYSFTIIKRILHRVLREKGMKSFNKRLYINHYDLKNNREVLSNTYSTIENIFKKIHFSCFVPFMFDGRPSICNKIDGVTPFIFPKRENVKILFISAISISNITTFSEVLYTDDTNVTYKMIQGILDMHAFYLTDKSSNMSHYIDNSLTSSAYFFGRKLLMYIIVMLINLYGIIQGKTNVSHYYLILKKVFQSVKHTLNVTT
tara:strand:+ start:106 stop:993 length:888 start_codon:yes stop_codon:yes gene_type:complete